LKCSFGIEQQKHVERAVKSKIVKLIGGKNLTMVSINIKA